MRFAPHLIPGNNCLPYVTHSSIVNLRRRTYPHLLANPSWSQSSPLSCMVIHDSFITNRFRMATGFSYWNDCVSQHDLEAMWNIPKVSAEWLKAGEVRGRKVHLSRDPDGQPYLTQTEMRAVADIIISRHFYTQIDPGMICAIAELESDRQLLVMRSTTKSKEATIGLMQLLPKTAEWLMSELGYRSYATEGNKAFLYQPFTNVYLGAAYIKWLSSFENKERSEEFIVRAYKGSAKKATHKSTLQYWKSYLSVKESFPSRKSLDDGVPLRNVEAPMHSHSGSHILSLENSRDTSKDTYWDSRVFPEDMKDMWNHSEIQKEWNESKESRGKVRFAHDEKHRPYISQVELKAVADIILFKYHNTRKFKSVVSMRFLHGIGDRLGIMGIDYSTAYWLYVELGYKAYKLESAEDLYNPFLSMYFGAAYVAWLSEYEGRERTLKFVVEAYCVGPKNVNPQEESTFWLKFEEAFSNCEETKRNRDSCSMM